MNYYTDIGMQENGFSQELWIPKWHPTPLNKLLKCNHWSKAAKYKLNDTEMVKAYVRQCKIAAATAKRRVILTIVLGKGQRACDPDAYWKSALDALVHAGALVDDNRQYVECAPVEFRRCREWGTSIMLENIT